MNPFPIDKLKEQIKLIESNYRFSDDMIFAAQLKTFLSKDSQRRSGRSFLLIKTLIELSIEEEREIQLFDHDGNTDERINQSIVEDVLNWYIINGVYITYSWRPISSNKIKVMFTLNINCVEAYNKIKVHKFQPEIKEKRQFSKLLLIL